MVRGIDTAAAGMTGITYWNDIIANNLANINTPGFKQTLVTFKNIQNMEVNKIDVSKGYIQSTGSIGSLSAGGVMDSTVFDLKQGSVKTTGNPLDLAINGEGFFAVQTPNGEAYTRNGSFIRRDDGVLTTIEGYPLLGKSGPITANINNSDVKDILIDRQGNITINKTQIDQLRIVNFDDPKSLQAQGSSLFTSTQPPVNANTFEVAQGALEQSNANAIESMVNSINGMRTYETLAKVIETNSRNLGKTVNEVGRVKR